VLSSPCPLQRGTTYRTFQACPPPEGDRLLSPSGGGRGRIETLTYTQTRSMTHRIIARSFGEDKRRTYLVIQGLCSKLNSEKTGGLIN